MKKIHLLLVLAVTLFLMAAAPAFADSVQFGRSINVPEGETRRGDAVCFGCSINVDGTLTGDVVAFGGSVRVRGKITGDVVAFGGSIHAEPGGEIGGDTVAFGGSVDHAPGSTIRGRIEERNGGRHMNIGAAGLGVFLSVIFVPILICGIVAAMLTFAIAGERRIAIVANTIRSHPAGTLLGGVIVFVAFWFIVIALHFPVPGLGFVRFGLMLVLLLLMLVGYTGLSLVFGSHIAGSWGAFAQMLIGALIIAFIQIIPFAGWVAGMAFTAFAVGAAALSGFGTSTEWFLNRGARAAPPA
jgi:hypothetical protein